MNGKNKMAGHGRVTIVRTRSRRARGDGEVDDGDGRKGRRVFATSGMEM